MRRRQPARPVKIGLGSVVASIVSLAILSGSAFASPQAAGIQAHLLWGGVDAAEMDRQLDAAKASGAGVVRVDVGWSSLEPDRKGQYSSWYLGKMDAAVAKAEQRGLKLLFTFWTTPCWASTAPDTVKQGCDGAWWDRRVDRYPPVNATDYAEALAFVIRRYGNRVAAWEIWNEPNLDDFFKTTNQIAEYAKLVKAAYPAAKAAGASTVIAGSLADADFAFTESLLRDHGVRGNFDAYSVHPYSGDRSPLDPNEDKHIRHSFILGVPAVRGVMLRNGEDKPLWLTEFGWSSCTYRSGPSSANCVDESTQAKHLGEAYTQMMSWSYVPVGVWFNLKNTSMDAGDRVDNYGLLRHDNTGKPAMEAFRTAATGLATSPPAQTPHPTPSPLPRRP
jgi:polysaccharide biosynthesis protein PslG